MAGDMRALKGALTERGKTYHECAKACEISTQTFNTKINGRVPFTCWEVKRLSEFLGLSNRDSVRIFLS